MNSICIIGVYFGKFNNYFPLWLKSCEHNPKIDFKIYTDVEYTGITPTNVFFNRISLQSFNELASRKLDIDINVSRPYKCCDLKPMYGLIFEDALHGYEYWGECDFDLIFGDLYQFLINNNYQSYDKFLSLGHLSLYRNTPAINKAFMLSGDYCGGWQLVVTSKENWAFDEIDGICKIFIKNNLKLFSRKIFADISPIYRRYKLSEYCYIDGDIQNNYKHQVFYWDNGKVYRAYIDKNSLQKEEFMYIHFRARPNYELSRFDLSSSSFYITNRGFFEKNEEVTKNEINKYNKYYSLLYELYERIKYKYNFLLNRIKKLVK